MRVRGQTELMNGHGRKEKDCQKVQQSLSSHLQLSDICYPQTEMLKKMYFSELGGNTWWPFYILYFHIFVCINHATVFNCMGC